MLKPSLARALRRSLTLLSLCVAAIPMQVMHVQAAESAASLPIAKTKVSKDSKKTASLPPRAQNFTQTIAPDQLSGLVTYTVLLAEIALQRGANELAADLYDELARSTDDPAVFERALEVTTYARRLDLGLEIARLWVASDPSAQRAQQSLTSLLLFNQRFDELVPHLIALLQNDPAALRANLLSLNSLFSKQTDRQLAFELIEKICAPFLGLPEAHQSLALAANAANDAGRALAETRRALELDPTWQPAALLQAQLLVRQSLPLAIDNMLSFLERNPNADELRLYLARCFLADQRNAEAEQQFAHLLKAYPDNADVVYA
ncbi:MAG: tetratricopeptide repeat protein, partial [Pseudomonadota bacterium]